MRLHKQFVKTQGTFGGMPRKTVLWFTLQPKLSTHRDVSFLELTYSRKLAVHMLYVSRMSIPEAPSGPIEGKYANFFQVGFNEVEFILEFGQEFEDGPRIHTRVVLSPANVGSFLRLTTESWMSFEERYGKKMRDN